MTKLAVGSLRTWQWKATKIAKHTQQFDIYKLLHSTLTL